MPPPLKSARRDAALWSSRLDRHREGHHDEPCQESGEAANALETRPDQTVRTSWWHKRLPGACQEWGLAVDPVFPRKSGGPCRSRNSNTPDPPGRGHFFGCGQLGKLPGSPRRASQPRTSRATSLAAVNRRRWIGGPPGAGGRPIFSARLLLQYRSQWRVWRHT